MLFLLPTFAVHYYKALELCMEHKRWFDGHTSLSKKNIDQICKAMPTIIKYLNSWVWF